MNKMTILFGGETMDNDFIKFKTIVPKEGDIEKYINKPVLDRRSGDPFTHKTIGVITSAIEVENGYELTVRLFGKYGFEWFTDGKLNSMSINTR